MKIAIYARVSTPDQSLDAQLHTLRDYAKRRDFVIAEEFLDKGVSGIKDRRPGLNRLMEAAFRKEFDAILVFRFDRFARSTKHLANALDEFKSLGIQFISYSENIDTSTPMGKAMFSIIGAMAQLERDIIIERIHSGISAARAKGTHMGRPKKLILNEVKKFKAMNWSIRKIAKKLKVGPATVHRALNVVVK